MSCKKQWYRLIDYDLMSRMPGKQKGFTAMYTTIEADIENGIVRSRDASRIPDHAHVLITLLASDENKPSTLDATIRGRTPHASIRGKIKILDNVMDTVCRDCRESSRTS